MSMMGSYSYRSSNNFLIGTFQVKAKILCSIEDYNTNLPTDNPPPPDRGHIPKVDFLNYVTMYNLKLRISI